MRERLRRSKPDRVSPPARPARQRHDLKRSRSLRPLLEGLEDRLVPATIAWNSAVSPAGGNWNVPANWVGNVVPTAADDAVIDLTAAGTVTVSDTRLANSLSADADTTISLSGSLTLASTSTIAGRYTQSAGTLTGAGTLTVTGALSWTGGTMSGMGVTNANGGLALGGTGNVGYTESLAGRTLNNAGAATLAYNAPSGGSGLILSGGAAFNNLAGATFNITNDAPISANSGGGTFNNAGTLAKTGGAGTSAILTTLNNTGTVNAQTGTLSLQGALSNYSAATNTLTGGSYIVAARLQFNNANIVTNAATIVLDGAGSQIVDASNNNAFRGFATNSAAGSFTLQGGRSLATPGAFANAGGLTVGAGSTFTAGGSYTQGAGSTNLVGGGVLASTTNNVAINGGLLGGVGTVNGNVGVGNDSRVAPGGVGTAGVLTVNGTYGQSAGPTLTIELGGPNPGTGYDQLNVTGRTELAGTLAVTPINGFQPAEGASFAVVGYNPNAGQFAAIAAQGFPTGTSLAANYTASSLILTARVTPVLIAVAVTPANPSVARGLTRQFTATGTYTDNTTANLTGAVTWASSNTNIATVAGNLATGVNVGGATISATLGSLVGSTTLTVTPAALVSIAVTPANPTITRGATRQFAATGTYTDNTTVDLTGQVAWVSTTPTVASITPTGLATGLAVGTTSISATLGGRSAATTLTVGAASLASISITPLNPSIVQGAALQFTATGTYTDSTTANLTNQVVWASANVAVATINASGVATGLAPGATSITATLDGVAAATTLTVTPATLVSIALLPANSSIPAGTTQAFAAIGTFSNGATLTVTDQVTWASSAVGVATISNAAGSKGLASAIAAGTTTISAALGSVAASTPLMVTSAAQSTVQSVGVAWGTAGFAPLATASDGVRLLPTGRTTSIPWAGIRAFEVRVAGAGLITAADVTATGRSGVDYGPVTVSGTRLVFTIFLARPIDAADRVTLTIGNAQIATFTRRLDVLPGDISDDGLVNAQDAALGRNAFVAGVMSVIADIDGDGQITIDDFNAVRRRVGTILPPLA